VSQIGQGVVDGSEACTPIHNDVGLIDDVGDEVSVPRRIHQNLSDLVGLQLFWAEVDSAILLLPDAKQEVLRLDVGIDEDGGIISVKAKADQLQDIGLHRRVTYFLACSTCKAFSGETIIIIANSLSNIIPGGVKEEGSASTSRGDDDGVSALTYRLRCGTLEVSRSVTERSLSSLLKPGEVEVRNHRKLVERVVE
jgi:hypothetical protein